MSLDNTVARVAAAKHLSNMTKPTDQGSLRLVTPAKVSAGGGVIVAARQTMNGKPVFSVPSKSVINFKSGFEKKLLCDGPTFTTGTACAFSCAFCFVPSAMKKQEAWLDLQGVRGKHEDVVIRRDNPIEIARRQLKNAKNKDKPLVIYASPLVDVAANMDLVRETVEMCKLILAETNWDIRLLSKSNLLPKIAQLLEVESPVGQWANPTSRNVLEFPRGRDDWKYRIIYGVSTGTLDDKLAQAFEEGCPLVSKRIQSLHWLQDNGFRTFGMVCPSLPQGDSPQDYEPWAQRMAEAVRYDRCEHVWAEVINLRGESFTRTIKALFDGGFGSVAMLTERIMKDKNQWEMYARFTYAAHLKVCPPEKLRFLQYASPTSWWAGKLGVVVL